MIVNLPHPQRTPPAKPVRCRSLLGATLVGFLAATALLGCAGAPPQPASLARMDRDLARGAELLAEGRLQPAGAAFARALAEAERSDDLARAAQARLGLGADALLREDYPLAQTHYLAAKREARSYPSLQASAQFGLAELARRSGDYPTARSALHALTNESAQPTAADSHVAFHIALALVDHASGKTLEALDRLESQANTARLRPENHAAWLAAHASILFADGDYGRAASAAERALTLDTESRKPTSIAADHALLAKIYLKSGDFPRAADHERRALRIFAHSGQIIPAERLSTQLRDIRQAIDRKEK